MTQKEKLSLFERVKAARRVLFPSDKDITDPVVKLAEQKGLYLPYVDVNKNLSRKLARAGFTLDVNKDLLLAGTEKAGIRYSHDIYISDYGKDEDKPTVDISRDFEEGTVTIDDTPTMEESSEDLANQSLWLSLLTMDQLANSLSRDVHSKKYRSKIRRKSLQRTGVALGGVSTHATSFGLSIADVAGPVTSVALHGLGYIVQGAGFYMAHNTTDMIASGLDDFVMQQYKDQAKSLAVEFPVLTYSPFMESIIEPVLTPPVNIQSDK
jgi:hypothetical protein